MESLETKGKQINLPMKQENAEQQKTYYDDAVNVERRNKVKAAMVHAWSSYEKYAWGFDELQVFPRFYSYLSCCIRRNLACHSVEVHGLFIYPLLWTMAVRYSMRIR
jgi:hypothetical protein